MQRELLILGTNGTGKSTLLDVLRSVRELATGEAMPDRCFPSTSRTRWQTLEQQTIELDMRLEEDLYNFRLQLEPWGYPPRTRVRSEAVKCNGRSVFEFVEGEVKLYNDSFQQKVTYPFDCFRSALATIQRRQENIRLMRFKDWLQNLHCLELDPRNMGASTDSEQPVPADDLANFADWYRHLVQERADQAARLQTKLREVLPGFASLDLRSAGGAVRFLSAKFSPPDGQSGSYEVRFDELFEGQRVLICLYAIVEFLVSKSTTVFRCRRYNPGLWTCGIDWETREARSHSFLTTRS